jgi:ribosomal protein L12E/L44/L45/RPP1/RPP2
MALDDIQSIVDIADVNDVSQSIKSLVGKTIDEVIKDRGRMMRAVERDSLLDYKKRLLTQKDLDEIEAVRQAAMTKTADIKATAGGNPPKKLEAVAEKKEPTLLERLLK